MAIKAQPLTAAARYVDPANQTGLTHAGILHFNQWQQSINSIPISVSGENVKGSGTDWKLANTPSAGVSLTGLTADGPITLIKGTGHSWNYTIQGAEITTAQAYESLTASYEYNQ